NYSVGPTSTLSDGTRSITATAADAAGNASSPSAASSVVIDTIRPTVTINQASTQSDPTSTSPIHFTVKFSEAVAGLPAGGVTVTGTAGGTKTITVVSSGGTDYDVAVSGMTTSGTVIASIGQNAASDTAANGNTASTSTDNTVTYNAQAAASLSVSSASGTYGGTANLSATLTSGGSGVSGKTVAFTLNGNSVGSATTNASGVASLAGASLSGINAGTYPTGVGASFAGDSGFAAANGSASLTVSNATPTITWSNPADISYSTALSATQLNATALFGGNSVAGNFTYTPAAGTVLSAGANQTLHVDFVPTDTSNYSNASKDVKINVGKAHLTVTADVKSKTYDGSAFSPFTAKLTGFVNGDTSSVVTGSPGFTGSALTAVNAGTYTITPTAGTLSATNYDFPGANFINGTLTIDKADATVVITPY